MGIASGLGAASADAFYGSLAALGLRELSGYLVDHASILRVGGGLLLLWMGATAMRRAASASTNGPVDISVGRRELIAGYGSTLVLTLANPVTILSFVGVIAALAGPSGGTTTGAILIVGVFLGSVSWWLVLVAGISRAHRMLPNFILRWIEAASGALLLGFGVYAVLFGAGYLHS
jgi:threonine/homoserine/homoserine lactone efflux protein